MFIASLKSKVCMYNGVNLEWSCSLSRAPPRGESVPLSDELTAFKSHVKACQPVHVSLLHCLISTQRCLTSCWLLVTKVSWERERDASLLDFHPGYLWLSELWVSERERERERRRRREWERERKEVSVWLITIVITPNGQATIHIRHIQPTDYTSFAGPGASIRGTHGQHYIHK